MLILLPVPGSSLLAKFCGPYTVQEKLSDTDYVIGTPDRRRKRLCHVNLMKPYLVYSVGVNSSSSPVVPSSLPVVVPVSLSQYNPESDGLVFICAEGCSRLRNSEMLDNLKSHLKHLDDAARNNVCCLIKDDPSLFADTSSRTTVLKHDIDVGDIPPIKHAYRVNPTKRVLF